MFIQKIWGVRKREKDKKRKRDTKILRRIDNKRTSTKSSKEFTRKLMVAAS